MVGARMWGCRGELSLKLDVSNISREIQDVWSVPSSLLTILQFQKNSFQLGFHLFCFLVFARGRVALPCRLLGHGMSLDIKL
jgi:hypothetical protein